MDSGFLSFSAQDWSKRIANNHGINETKDDVTESDDKKDKAKEEKEAPPKPKRPKLPCKMPKWEIEEDIVVSGISGTFPESDNVEELKANLYGKVDLITDNDRRWETGQWNVQCRTGKLKDVTRFDSVFFGVNGQNVEDMDPQSRLLIEATYGAIFDAGYDAWSLRGKKIGVFIGANDKSALLDMGIMSRDSESRYRGMELGMMANNISKTFDFTGPSITMDTACSASFHGLTLAFQALRNNRCDAAIVGGCTVTFNFALSQLFVKFGLASKEGKCKVFDATANGYVRSEGVAVAFLQRKSDARRCYATILHCKMLNEGAKTEGITFPKGEQQMELYRQVYGELKMDPTVLDFVEAHGTGTTAGDREETNGIADFFLKDRDRPLMVGSVKSNLGHTEASSGMLSLIKVILSMEDEMLIPNLHFTEANPEIPALVEGKLQVITEPTPWKPGIVGINNFGFGGSNVHAVLKCNDKTKENQKPREIPRLALVCGRSERGVEYIFGKVKEENYSDEAIHLLEEACKYPSSGMCYRGYALVGNAEEEFVSVVQRAPRERLPVCFLFSGNQLSGTTKGMMKIDAYAKSVRSSADILRPYGLDLVRLLTEATAKEQARPVVQLVTLTAVQVALVDVMKSIGVESDQILGVSNGKIAADYARGSCTAKEALTNAYRKGKSREEMQEVAKKSLFRVPASMRNHNSNSVSAMALRNLNKNDGVLEELINELKHVPRKSILIDFSLQQEPDDWTKSGLRDGQIYVSLMTLEDDRQVFHLLSSLGQLYLSNLNPSVSNLYKPIEYPVPRSTPMLSSLIKWDHSKKWIVKDYYHLKSCRDVYKVKTDLGTDQEYLLSYRLDGKVQFPRMGYLFFVWDIFCADNFKTCGECPVIMEDICFYRTAYLPDDGCYLFIVKIMTSTGDFQIFERELLLVTGKIKFPEKVTLKTTDDDMAAFDDSFTEKCFMLNAEDFYKELRLRGYEYGPEFKQVIKAETSGLRGSLRWDKRWTTFLDAMIQVPVLSLPKRARLEPKRIKTIRIDPSLITEDEEKDFTFVLNPNINVCRSGPVEIQGMQWEIVPKRTEDKSEAILEKQVFLPFFDSNILSISERERINEYSKVCSELARRISREMAECHEDETALVSNEEVGSGSEELKEKGSNSPETNHCEEFDKDETELFSDEQEASDELVEKYSKSSEKAYSLMNLLWNALNPVCEVELPDEDDDENRNKRKKQTEENNSRKSIDGEKTTEEIQIENTNESGVGKGDVQEVVDQSKNEDLKFQVYDGNEDTNNSVEGANPACEQVDSKEVKLQNNIHDENGAGKQSEKSQTEEPRDQNLESGTELVNENLLKATEYSNVHSEGNETSYHVKNVDKAVAISNDTVEVENAAEPVVITPADQNTNNRKRLEVTDQIKSPEGGDTGGNTAIESQTEPFPLDITVPTPVSIRERLTNLLQENLKELQNDLLSKVSLRENVLRGVLDIVQKNTQSQTVNILEISAYSCVQKEVVRMLDLITRGSLKTNYTVASVGTECIPDDGMHPETRTITWVNTNSILCEYDFAVAKDLFTDSCLPVGETLEAISSALKDDGFIVIMERTSLSPAEQFLASMTGKTRNEQGEASLEKSFSKLGLEVIARKQDMVTSVTYLLRKVGKESLNNVQGHEVVKVVEQHNNLWVEEVKRKMEVNAQKKKGGRIFLLAESLVSGVLGNFDHLRNQKGGENLRLVYNASLGRKSSELNFNLYSTDVQDLLRADLSINVYRDGVWGQISAQSFDESPALQMREHVYLKIRNKGDLSSLEWIESELEDSSWLEVEVEEAKTDAEPGVESEGTDEREAEVIGQKKILVHVYYAPINDRDLMLTTGQIPSDALSDELCLQEGVLGMEFSGRDQSGRRVMAATLRQALATSVAVPSSQVVEVPKEWSLEEASSVPIAYLTAYYALVVRAQITNSTSVLIHSATESVGQAAVAISLHTGCKVYVTVGTEEKKRFLQELYPEMEEKNILSSADDRFEFEILNATKGKGVDVVLNSLRDDQFLASIRCMSFHGLLLQIGKLDVAENKKLGMAVFLKNITIHGVEIDSLFGGAEMVECIAHLKQGLEEGVVKPIKCNVFAWQEAQEAFSFMAKKKHIGKVVIKMRDEEVDDLATPSKIKIPCTLRTYCNPVKSVIVTGDLNSIAFEVASWLVGKGARKIVLSSPTGIANGYQKLQVQQWTEQSVQFRVLHEDITSTGGVQLLINEASQMGPVQAIFHIDMEGFSAVPREGDDDSPWKTKLKVVMDLDNYSRQMCPELRYFAVCTSNSFENGGPGNCYAQAFIRRLMEQRRNDCLPGVAIHWNGLGDVGQIYEQMGGNDAILEGSVVQKLDTCLTALDRLIHEDFPVVSSFVPIKKMALTNDTDLIQLIRSALGVGHLSPAKKKKRFFKLGMDLPLASKVTQVLEKEYRTLVTPSQVLEMTFTDLHSFLDYKNSESKDVCLQPVLILDMSIPTNVLAPLNKVQSTECVFFVHSLEGHTANLARIASCVEKRAYGLQFTKDVPHKSVQEIAVFYVQEVKKVQPEGPYHICGYSYGCLIAFEMAIALQKTDIVKTFICLDGSPSLVKEGAKSWFPSSSDGDCGPVAGPPFMLIADTYFTNVSEDIRTVIKKDIVETPVSLEENIAFFTNIMQTNVPPETVASVVEQTSRLARAAVNYQSSVQFRGKATIIMSYEKNKNTNLNYVKSQGYGMNEFVDGTVEVLELACSHKELLRTNPESTALIINSRVKE